EEKNIDRPPSCVSIRRKTSDFAELYDRVPLGAVVQIIPDGLPKLAKAKPLPVQPSVPLVAATAQPENEMQSRLALAKPAKAPRVLATDSVVAATALAAPPQHLMQTQP